MRGPRRQRWWRRLLWGRILASTPAELVSLPAHRYETACIEVTRLQKMLDQRVRELAEQGALDEGTGDALDALIETWRHQANERLRMHHANQQGRAAAHLAARRRGWAVARARAEQEAEAHRDTDRALQLAKSRYESALQYLAIPEQRLPQPDVNSVANGASGDRRSSTL